MRSRFPAVLALLCALSAHGALNPQHAADDYARLQQWQFSPAVLLTAPVSFTRDTATWTFESGSVRLMEPASDGSVTGLVFEGKGRFRMSVPDRHELAQLRRFAKQPQLEAVDQPFTQLVLRTSDPSLAKLFPSAPAQYAPYGLAEKRHEAWLIDLRLDADAQVLAAMLNPGATELVAAMNTAGYDWITYEYDSTRDEEISLTHFQARVPEVWVSLDAPEHRDADGRPGAQRSAVAALTHIDVKADLTKSGSTPGASRHNQRPIDGHYVVEATFRGEAESAGALRLTLGARARKVRAFDERGEALAIFRDSVGKRGLYVDDRVHDDEFVVVLAQPLTRGAQQRIRFEYDLETRNYAPGGIWYPTFRDAFHQKHTARLELTVRKRNELRAIGRMESRREDERGETSIWIVDQPTAMTTFSTATRFEEVKVQAENIPTVIAFGPDYQLDNTRKSHNVAADVANSLMFFQKFLGSPIGGEQFYVTSVAGGHGQAFEGFLHMGEFTFASDHPGASELFRAHEVAHEWWGHKVGWRSYRDQWLSESLAQYSAMLFVKETVKHGDGYFHEILRAYDGIVKGNLSGGFSKFSRPGLIERNIAERNRLGPIGHGRRAGTRDMPFGYVVQAYHKGPLVLHMMRMLLLYRTQSDATFIGILRNFVHEYEGKSPSTEDFRRVVERNSKMEWGWFFDSWIYGADLPSYTWKSEVRPSAGGFALTVDVERRDASSGFTAVIPVRVDLETGKSMLFYLVNREAKQSVTHQLPAKPKNIVFAPDSSLLAHVRRD